MRMLALIHQEESYRPLFKLLRLRSHEAPLFDSNGPRRIYCRFVNEGYLAIAWDGEVSPYLALMHSYGCLILDRYKEIRRYSLGNIRKKRLEGDLGGRGLCGLPLPGEGLRVLPLRRMRGLWPLGDQ